MTETYQYCIDDLQGAVYCPETADPDFLRDSAAQYAEACAEANERLRQVARLLHRGLRSEALQLAQEEPHVLDTVATLDFPELPTWCELIKAWGMAAPPRLLTDLAAEINQAYADQQPQEALLKRHRLLALAHGPLSARIDTLRRIGDLDPGNVAWETDLAALEKARLKELDAAAKTASSSRDLATLTSMVRELEADGWTVAVPPDLLSRTKRMEAALAMKLARLEMEQIADELHGAHVAQNEEQGLELLGRWKKADETVGLDRDDPLAERAAPTLEWLAGVARGNEEKRNQSATSLAIERALDDDAPLDELEHLFEAAGTYSDPIPPVLGRRGEQRIGELKRHRRKKDRILIVSIVTGLLVVGTLVGLVIWQQGHRQAVTASSIALQSFIDQGHLKEAKRYHEELASDVRSAPEVRQQKTRLDKAEQDEQERRQGFERAMDRAEKSGPETPDLAALAEARRLARLPSEKQRLVTMQSKIGEAHRRKQAAQDEDLAKRIREFQERTRQIEAAGGNDYQTALAALEPLRREINAAKSEFPVSSRALLAQLEPLLARVDKLRDLWQTRQLEQRDRAALTAAVGNLARYRAALDAFAAHHPNASLASNLAKLRKETRLWEGLIAWNALLQTNPLRSASYVSAAQAADYLARGHELQKQYGNIPLAQAFANKEAYLETVTHRVTEERESLVGNLKKLFRDYLIGRLWMVIERRHGNRFYCRQDPVAGNEAQSIHIKYVADLALTMKGRSIRRDDIAYSGLAPQSQAAEEGNKLLDSLEERGWEATFADLIMAVAGQDEMDPILKITFLKHVLEPAMTGSKVLADSLGNYSKELDGGGVDLSANWLDSRDKQVEAERDRARFLLGSLPDLKELIRSALANARALREQRTDQYRWVGWLSRDVQGNWQVLRAKSAPLHGDLLVIYEPADHDTAAFYLVGRTKNGVLELISRDGESFVDGRAVFLREPGGAPGTTDKKKR